MNIVTSLVYSVLTAIIAVFRQIEYFVVRFFADFAKYQLNNVLNECDVKLNGDRRWDIKVNDERFFEMAIVDGTLGVGEAYIKGWCDCDDLLELSFRLNRSDVSRRVHSPRNRFFTYLLLHGFNLQTKARCWEVAQKHYDLGNHLFSSFLDETMNYSCGYWRSADNLKKAQIDKMQLIAKKLMLKPGMKVLDIGCGWGSLCKYLSDNFDVSVVGITVSVEQAKLAQVNCKNSDVEIRVMDYRELNEKFDRVVSVGMFEHVGKWNYRQYFDTVNRCLTSDGIFLLHTIGVNHEHQTLIEPWAHTYIFPNGMVPYYRHITDYSEGLFVIEDWHNFGDDYHKTLLAWHNNYSRAWLESSELRSQFGDEFNRMWNYYLLMAAGLFKSRKFNLWQIVFTKNGLIGGYESQR